MFKKLLYAALCMFAITTVRTSPENYALASQKLTTWTPTAKTTAENDLGRMDLLLRGTRADFCRQFRAFLKITAEFPDDGLSDDEIDDLKTQIKGLYNTYAPGFELPPHGEYTQAPSERAGQMPIGETKTVVEGSSWFTPQAPHVKIISAGPTTGLPTCEICKTTCCQNPDTGYFVCGFFISVE